MKNQINIAPVLTMDMWFFTYTHTCNTRLRHTHTRIRVMEQQRRASTVPNKLSSSSYHPLDRHHTFTQHTASFLQQFLILYHRVGDLFAFHSSAFMTISVCVCVCVCLVFIIMCDLENTFIYLHAHTHTFWFDFCVLY